jgi:hypothetical protein
MRRVHLLTICSLLGISLTASSATAQRGRVRATPRAWLEVGDGIGVNSGGGALTSGSLWQLFRAAGVLAISRDHGIEVSAMRGQELVPVQQRLFDPRTTVKGDAVFLSYTHFDRLRDGGIPTTLSIGPGVMRRAPLDIGGPDRETWAAQAGVETNVYNPPVGWADLAVGLRVLVVPGMPKRQAALLTLSFSLRAG